MNRSLSRLKLAVSVLFFVFPLHLAWAESGLGSAGNDGGFDAAVSDDTLAGQRGMALITNTNDLDAALYSNSATDVVTGTNVVRDGSLANNSGMSTVIQNSGNNVLIQSAVILNIQMQ
jgi:hypothetical protein